MKRILTLAATEYNMRADKQALLSERGFVFDGDLFGDECTISLRPIDEQAGWYFLVLNSIKIPFFLLQTPPLITKTSFLCNLRFLPLVWLGAVLGVYLVNKIPQVWFTRFVVAMTIVAAVRLLWPV